jgi:uncharacterized membrane protein YdjX (TVP38/TMEM64 family)
MGLQQSVLSYLVYQAHPHDQAQIIHKKQTSDRTFRFSIERQSLQIIFQCIEPFFPKIRIGKSTSNFMESNRPMTLF